MVVVQEQRLVMDIDLDKIQMGIAVVVEMEEVLKPKTLIC
jgi:hypothetical protein